MRNQIDEIDLISLVMLPLAAGIVFGVWSLSLDVFGGFSLDQTLIEVGGTVITLAAVLAVASIGALVAQGHLSQGDYQKEEWYVIAGSMAVVPLYVFVPLVQDLFAMSDLIPLGVWVALSGVSVYISYKG